MFEKRVLHSWRNRAVSITQLLLPFVFTLVACLVLETFPGPRDPPAMDLVLSHYGDPVAPYSINLTSDDDNSTEYAEDMAETYRLFLEAQGVPAPLVNEEEGYEDSPDMDAYLGEVGADDFDSYVTFYMTAATFEGDRDPLLHNESTLVTTHFHNEAYHTPAGRALCHW